MSQKMNNNLDFIFNIIHCSTLSSVGYETGTGLGSGTGLRACDGFGFGCGSGEGYGSGIGYGNCDGSGIGYCADLDYVFLKDENV
jgi:hypothetical protein